MPRRSLMKLLAIRLSPQAGKSLVMRGSAHIDLLATLLKRFASILIPALCFSSTLAIATPNIQHWQSASGAKVLFVEDHNIPMLDVAVTVPAGSSFDTAEKSGVAAMTHQLLD
jgi:zinc protease